MDKLKPMIKKWLPAVVFFLFLGGLHGIVIRANTVMRAEERKKKEEEEAAKAAGEPKVIYTCSMDPQIRWDHPGLCPICSMDLIPVSGEAGIGITLEPRYLQLAGIRTAPVLHRALHREIRTVGIFEPDATRRRTVSAWVGGRLDALHVDYTGQKVDAGQPLASLYSHELTRSRDEFLTALAEADRAGKGGLSPEEKTRVHDALGAARSRLLRFGLSEEQILEIESKKEASSHFEIRAPAGGTVLHKNVKEGDYVHTGHALFHIADLSVLWLVLDVYENELDSLRVGQEVLFEPGAYPGERIRGFVTFIEPTLDAIRRTVRVRVPVDNKEGRFRPGMFVKARIEVDLGPNGEVLTPTLGTHVCPRHPEIVRGGAGNCPLDGEALVARNEAPLPEELWACSMDCAHYDHEGPCPVCGMTMNPLPPDVVASTTYVCLLHPPVRSERPGTCAEDGKPLIPYTRLSGRSLAIPRDGLLTIGTRHFVFEKVGKGKFEPREISVGPATGRFVLLRIVPRTGQYYPHLQTVRRGDAIVVDGAYYIDSQLQFQAKLSIFAPALPALEALAPAESFLSAYFLAGRGLAGDRVEKFDGYLARMKSASGEALAAKVPAMAHSEAPTRELQAHFRHMSSALKAQKPVSMGLAREIFAELGEGMRMYVEEVHAGIYGATEFHLFKDPETGRIWAQADEDPANPYRGKAGQKMAEKIGTKSAKKDAGPYGEGSGSKGGGAHANH